MAEEIPRFLKMDGDSVLFKNPKGKLKFFVPEIYFERKLAIEYGEVIYLLGLFHYTIEDENGKNNGLHTINYPSIFATIPSETEKLKKVQLLKTAKEDDYRVLEYVENDVVIQSIYTEEDVGNADTLLSMSMTGKLPTTISYQTSWQIFPENFQLNGESYGISPQLFGIYQGEMCRSKDDIKVLFRHTDMKDMTNYQYIPTKLIPKYISAYTAFTSENMDEAITHAAIIKSHKEVPLEKIMM